MHIEIQVALNFVISYLYNKLPRRRVNIFGEELEKALKDKFQGHWYPEKPYKGSAFRCLKTGDPIDKMLERAAVESGVTIHDILENLPQELAVWVDPGEVSYRIGEKGAVKILFSDKMDPQEDHCVDREVTKTFNPEAQCFRPIEAVANSMSQLSLSPNSAAQQQQPASYNLGGAINNNQVNGGAHAQQLQNKMGGRRIRQTTGQAVGESSAPVETIFGTIPAQAPHLAPNSAAPSPTGQGQGSFKGSPSPATPFIPRTMTPLTFTTATFAQTKFGSTKLKTSSKRANRMSPTEFSNYIKHRAIQQQMQQQHHSPGGRAVSPDPSQYYFHPQAAHYPPHQFPPRNGFESSNHFLAAPEIYQNKFNQIPFEHSQMGGGQFHPQGGVMNSPHPPTPNTPPQENGKLMDSNWPYAAAGQYQHLLVAN